MRRLLSFILLAFVLAGPVSAQDTAADNGGKNRFSIKSYAFRGTYLDSGTHFEKFGAAAPAGVNLGLEFPSQQQYPWQQYLNNATVGIGLSWMDMGHKMLGHSVALYPYILFNAIDTDFFQMRFKVAGGIAGVTEHWYTQEDQDPEHYYKPTVNTVFRMLPQCISQRRCPAQCPYIPEFSIGNRVRISAYEQRTYKYAEYRP